jgi:anti-sigma-K factor RskA
VLHRDGDGSRSVAAPWQKPRGRNRTQPFEVESVHKTMTRPGQSEGDRPRDELLAGEYVLGVLSLEARAKVEARIRTDKAFAAIVARWQENLARPDDDYVTLVQPDFAAPVFRARELALPSRSGKARPFAPMLDSLALWRSLAFCFLFLLVGTVLFAERPPSAVKAAAPVLADLQALEGNSLALVARYDAASGALRLAPVAAGTSQSHSLQVWLTRGNEPAVSLGVLPSSGSDAMVVPGTLRAKLNSAGATLSVSLEPPGGSPTGKPTGHVLVTGQTQAP